MLLTVNTGQPSGAAQGEHDKKNKVLWRLRGRRLVGCGATEEPACESSRERGVEFQREEKEEFQAEAG